MAKKKCPFQCHPDAGRISELFTANNWLSVMIQPFWTRMLGIGGWTKIVGGMPLTFIYFPFPAVIVTQETSRNYSIQIIDYQSWYYRFEPGCSGLEDGPRSLAECRSHIFFFHFPLSSWRRKDLGTVQSISALANRSSIFDGEWQNGMDIYVQILHSSFRIGSVPERDSERSEESIFYFFKDRCHPEIVRWGNYFLSR